MGWYLDGCPEIVLIACLCSPPCQPKQSGLLRITLLFVLLAVQGWYYLKCSRIGLAVPALHAVAAGLTGGPAGISGGHNEGHSLNIQFHWAHYPQLQHSGIPRSKKDIVMAKRCYGLLNCTNKFRLYAKHHTNLSLNF